MINGFLRPTVPEIAAFARDDRAPSGSIWAVTYKSLTLTAENVTKDQLPLVWFAHLECLATSLLPLQRPKVQQGTRKYLFKGYSV